MSDKIFAIKQLRQDNISNSTEIVQKDGIPYYKCILEGQVKKIGYTCPLDMIQYPIYFTVNGVEQKITIGKNGIYEVSAEETFITVSEVFLPQDVDFIFDYETFIPIV